MKKEITCTVCPMGCLITVEGEGDSITSIEGYTCPRGEQYGRTEFLHPVRILTSTVRTCSEKEPLLPVRSASPVPKEKLMDCMAEIRKVMLDRSVKVYDVIIPDICGTGIDIVASKDMDLSV